MPVTFKPGDFVTRDGTDIHRVLSINEAGDLIDVVCVKAALGYLNDDGTRDAPWCEIGDTESNLTRRYDFCDPAIEHCTAPEKALPNSSRILPAPDPG